MPSEFDKLTPVQQKVITLLANGSTASAAAEEAGIHRNTIANWRRASPAFAREFHALHYERALYWRESVQAIAGTAVETLRSVMINTNTPPGVRVRAALAVLNTLMTPVPDPPNAPPDAPPDNVVTMPTPPPDAGEAPQKGQTPPPAQHNKKVAQLCTTPSPTSTPDAQATPKHPTPKRTAAQHRRGERARGSHQRYENASLTNLVA